MKLFMFYCINVNFVFYFVDNIIIGFFFCFVYIPLKIQLIAYVFLKNLILCIFFRIQFFFFLHLIKREILHGSYKVPLLIFPLERTFET